jgi:hypothetical protein
MADIQCPRCGKTVPELKNLDPGVALKVTRETGAAAPAAVCLACYLEVNGSVGPAPRIGLVHAREKAREQKKLMLWKSRVNLIKAARALMTEKKYSEAAVQYEKYLKVLEIVFDCQPGHLKPEDFKDSARTQELTVVASVYWDLVRIYDTSEKYGDRMSQATKKLAQFLRFTPVYPDVMRKAEAFVKSARNPNVVKNFLKAAKTGKGRCFIAGSAFGPEAFEVVVLQNWRDQYLLKSKLGFALVQAYYLVSPPIAYFLDVFPSLKAPVRKALRLFISYL